MAMSSDGRATEYEELWRVRRKLVRTAATPLFKYALEASAVEKETKVDEKKQNSLQQSTLITVAFVAISAAVLRIGGRAALVSVLGLDFINNNEIRDSMNGFLDYFHGLGTEATYAVFFLAWLVAKTLCIDFLTIILAVSSGCETVPNLSKINEYLLCITIAILILSLGSLLFGGFWQGTLASVCASTIASSIDFQVLHS